jgi:hypothetical protein
MKIVAAVFADFEETFLGGPSQLRTEIGGRTVLGRTLARLMRVEGLAARCLFVRPRDHELAARAVRESGLNQAIEVLPLDAGFRPRRTMMQAARKWNLESWRGGLLGATGFDEFVEPVCAAQVLNRYEANAVLCLDGHQAALDPRIATAMVAHQVEYAVEAKLVFTQCPPGLAGMVLSHAGVRDLLQMQIPVGLLVSYRPELAQLDPIVRASCLHVAPEIAHTAARFTADTRRSRELLAAALTELGDEADARALCEWSRRPDNQRAGMLPVEVELELTTADPLPGTRLYPRGECVPRRTLEDLDAVARVAGELAAFDDRMIVLGGHGDPLLHPRFDETCRRIRAAGVSGLGVVTTLVEFPDSHLDAMIENRVDVVEIRLDAHSPETYARVHGSAAFETVIANIMRLNQVRKDRNAPQPLIAPRLTRCEATIGELEGFFDHWIRETGSAIVRGYDRFCGTLPADGLLPATSSIREPCRRLASRLMLLADGNAPMCSEDFRGETSLGSWRESSLAEIWRGGRLADLRTAHKQLCLETHPLCQLCTEWSRP